MHSEQWATASFVLPPGINLEKRSMVSVVICHTVVQNWASFQVSGMGSLPISIQCLCRYRSCLNFCRLFCPEFLQTKLHTEHLCKQKFLLCVVLKGRVLMQYL